LQPEEPDARLNAGVTKDELIALLIHVEACAGEMKYPLRAKNLRPGRAAPSLTIP
jgi:hypothetical protein